MAAVLQRFQNSAIIYSNPKQKQLFLSIHCHEQLIQSTANNSLRILKPLAKMSQSPVREPTFLIFTQQHHCKNCPVGKSAN